MSDEGRRRGNDAGERGARIPRRIPRRTGAFARGAALALTLASAATAPALAQVSVTPANSIAVANRWVTRNNRAINLNHGALPNQSAHKVFGGPRA